jgi:hypothetical protein
MSRHAVSARTSVTRTRTATRWRAKIRRLDNARILCTFLPLATIRQMRRESSILALVVCGEARCTLQILGPNYWTSNVGKHCTANRAHSWWTMGTYSPYRMTQSQNRRTADPWQTLVQRMAKSLAPVVNSTTSCWKWLLATGNLRNATLGSHPDLWQMNTHT